MLDWLRRNHPLLNNGWVGRYKGTLVQLAYLIYICYHYLFVMLPSVLVRKSLNLCTTFAIIWTLILSEKISRLFRRTKWKKEKRSQDCISPMLWLTVWIDPVLEFQEEDGMSDSYQVELFFRGEKKFLLVNSQASCSRQDSAHRPFLNNPIGDF